MADQPQHFPGILSSLQGPLAFHCTWGVPGMEAGSLGESKPPATRGILPSFPIAIKKGVS
jgi:hypothetical protein